MSIQVSLKNKIQIFYSNLQARAIVFSLLIHILFLVVYFVLSRQDETSFYDFGSESFFNGTPQASKSSEKKLNVLERQKEEKIVPQKSEEGEMSSDQAASQASSESAGDEAEIANAVDLSFLPNATAPHLVGSLKQYYPEAAREMNVEATVYISIIISKKGKVIKVKVHSVVLSKKLPDETENLLKTKFAESIRRSLAEVHFSSPMVNGKNVPIEMEQMVKYKLNE